MCKSKLKIMRWLLGLMVLAVIAGTGQVAYGQAGVGGSATPSFTSPLVVGQTLAPATLAIHNSSTQTTDASFTSVQIVVCKNGDFGFSGGVGSCSATNDLSGIISFSATGTGVSSLGANPTCVGTWTISTSGNRATFTGPSGTLTLSTASAETCTISFTIGAIALPASGVAFGDGAVDIAANALIGGALLTGTGTGQTQTSIESCSATVDKQVSCDGGTTWQDVTGTDDSSGTSNLGCIAPTGGTVQFRFIVKNTGTAIIGANSCTISDSNSSVLSSTLITSSIDPGGTVSFGDATDSGVTNKVVNDATCNLTTAGAGNNTVTLTGCSCPVSSGSAVTITDKTDQATYGCCGVQVDKQVSCTNGTPTGAQDTGFVSANEDGTNGCATTFGQSVSANYQAKNTGNVPLVCTGTGLLGGTLGLVDTFVVNSQSTFTGSANIDVGATAGPFADTNITTCSTTLNSNESLGDKITANCECQASATFANTVKATADDIAQIQCSATPPNFTITKSCTPVSGVAGSFTADVKVTNIDTVNQISCQLVDQYVAGTCGTAPACPVAGGTGVTLSPNPLVVPVSSFADATGTITGLTATACNQACGSCSNGVTCSTDANCPAFAGTTAACVSGSCVYSPTTAAQAECPIGSCFERTPGYWGTHPQVTSTLLPLTVCGQSLTTTTAKQAGSATENLCENGQDAKNGKGNSFYTSPQQLQLIRQCTAAALNLAASGLGGGLTAGISACEAADPGISATFNSCCVGTGSVCDSSSTSTAISASNCITLLDAFNSLDNGDFSTVNLTNSPAQPYECKAASGNGFTNCTAGGLGGTIQCGTK